MIDINDISLEKDKYLTKILLGNKIVNELPKKIIEGLTYLEKGNLLINHIKVTEKSFPDLFKIAHNFSNELKIACPTLFVAGSTNINAFTFGSMDSSYVLFYSRLLDSFEDKEIEFVIGHELGHIASNHVVLCNLVLWLFQGADVLLTKVTGLGKMLSVPLRILLRYKIGEWMRYSEYSCDRFGYLCCKDVDASLRALLKLKIGMIKDVNIDINDYLKQYSEIKENYLYNVKELFYDNPFATTHPSIFKRILALQWFIDNYQNKRFSKEELDKKLDSLVTFSPQARAFSSDEAFEKLLIQLQLFLGLIDKNLEESEVKEIKKTMEDFKISKTLSDFIDEQLGKGLKIENLDLNINLSDAQKNFLIDSLFSIPKSRKDYTPEDDLFLLEISKRLNLDSAKITEMRKKMLRKYVKKDARSKFPADIQFKTYC